MSISVADPTRLPTASLDAAYRLAELNSRKLPGQQWIPLGKRSLPTVVRAVGTPTGIIYASPGKQPPGLSSPATTAQLQATCYYGNAKGVYLQVPGEWWIYLDSATAETIVVYDDISTAAILQSLGIALVGGSSGLSADVGNTDADADFAKANNALSVRANLAGFSPDSNDWVRLFASTPNQVDGDTGGSTNYLHAIAAMVGRDITGGGANVMRLIEGRSISNFTGAADSLIALLSGAVAMGRVAGGATISPVDCEGILGVEALSTAATRRLLSTNSLIVGRDSVNALLRILEAQDNDATMANQFGTNAAAQYGLAVNARQRWLDQCVTATAVADAAVTCTLPAPGANLRQHISRIEISRFGCAAGPGGGAPIIVTTTNLVGTPAFDFESVWALGSLTREILEQDHVIRASAANTAVTVVAPATAGALWRITVFYYNA